MNSIWAASRPNRRTLLKGGAAVAASLGALPTFVGRASAATPGHLVFGLSSYPPSLHPWKNVGTAALTVKYQIYRGLLAYDATGGLRPEIAESWEAEDPQTYRFTLRENATFHDGSPVTSADVKATYEAITAPDSVGASRVALSIISSIETPDDRTVRFRLNAPSATFVYSAAASPYTLIVKKETLAGEPENYVGAGPYRVVSLERGTRIDLEAYEGFYKPGIPRSASLSFVAYKDENLRVAALEAADVDIIEYVPWQSMDAVDQNEDLTLDTTSGPFMYLMFNCNDGPLANPMVRDAIGYAIRREDVMAAAFFGRGSALRGMPIQASSPFYNDELANHWSYDPERAKAMLSEAGYSDGFDATLLSTGQYNMHKDTAEVCQQHLAAVGINVQLNLPDWPTRIDLGNQGQYDIGVMGSGGEFNDPDALANFVDGRRGISYGRSVGFNDDMLNELTDRGRAEIDFAKRKEIYDAWQKRALETVPLVGINWRAQGYGFQTSVAGFKGLPGFLTFYSGLMIEEAAVS